MKKNVPTLRISRRRSCKLQFSDALVKSGYGPFEGNGLSTSIHPADLPFEFPFGKCALEWVRCAVGALQAYGRGSWVHPIHSIIRQATRCKLGAGGQGGLNISRKESGTWLRNDSSFLDVRSKGFGKPYLQGLLVIPWSFYLWHLSHQGMGWCVTLLTDAGL
ncbi:hypothetical protein GOP47_0016542 [Adiantum capillus-veneris]|uniref:Uncharacterized protein n=1 Tax=Adiantum capillus-veneris TaxID=13818 RepID=A0A9D4ZBU1_ADICA|nr:hypothetical protein GOP47_0016542 [Adiantum capillus-veneris]